MLPSCAHVFCLQCIRGWRSSELAQYERSKATAFGCPICRASSGFVVPSDVLPAGPEAKAEMIRVFKANLRAQRCKYWSAEQRCPFGNSCFYAHLNLSTVSGVSFRPMLWSTFEILDHLRIPLLFWYSSSYGPGSDHSFGCADECL